MSWLSDAWLTAAEKYKSAACGALRFGDAHHSEWCAWRVRYSLARAYGATPGESVGMAGPRVLR